MPAARLRSFLSLLVSQGWVKIGMAAYWVLAARVLAAEDFGRFTFVMAIGAILTGVSELGTGLLFIREAGRNPQSEDALTFLLLLFRIGILTAAGAVFALMLFLTEPDREKWIGAALFALALMGAVVCDMLNRRLQISDIFWPTALLPAIQTLLPGSLGLILVHQGGSWIWILILMPVCSFSAAGAWLGWVQKWRPFARRISGWTHEAVPLLRQFIPFGVLSAIYALNSRLDHLLVGHWLGNEALGYYRSAGQILDGFYILSLSLITVLLPTMAKMAAAQSAELPMLVRRAVRTLIILGFPVACGLAILADPAVRLVYGDSYAGAAAAVPGFSVLSMMLLVTAPVGQWLLMIERWRALLAAGLAGGICYALAGMWLIPRMGIAGGAWARVSGECIGWCILEYSLRRNRTGVSIFAETLKLVPALMVFAFGAWGAWKVLGMWGHALAGIVYAGIVWRLGILKRPFEERSAHPEMRP